MRNYRRSTVMSFQHLAPFDVFQYDGQMYVKSMPPPHTSSTDSFEAVSIRTSQVVNFTPDAGVRRTNTLPRLMEISSYDDERSGETR